MGGTDDVISADGFTASRRLFLRAALAAAGAMACAAPSIAGDEPLQLERIVVDDRFPEAVALARSMARDGAPISATSGDLTDLWRNDFRLAWRRAPMTLGGVTTPGGLFVLETLAADHRMRVIRRTELAPVGSRETPLVSWIIAPRLRSAPIA
jgi:hypothetical protein